MKKIGFIAAALGLTVLATSCTTVSPRAESARETGRRLVERFLSREPEQQNYNCKTLMYWVVCTWVGALDYAELTGDAALMKRLADNFEPFFGPKKSYVPTRRHVDHSMFGSLPLALYRRTNDRKLLDMGLGFADRQWTPIPNTNTLGQRTSSSVDGSLGQRTSSSVDGSLGQRTSSSVDGSLGQRTSSSVEDISDPNEWLKQGYTPETRLWMDDMFMITTVQLEAYKATGDRKYADRAAKEMVLYLDRLQLKDGPNAGLYNHAPDVPFIWGRGDGWMAAGTALLMKNLPKDQPEFPRILEGYRLMMKALKKYQRPDGLWGQLVDDPKIWAETSGSAMFAYSMAVGLNRGWLDRAEYEPCVVKAYDALCGQLTPEGDIQNVCVGTNKKNDHQWYVDRPRRTGDLHGQAPFLWLCCELMK